MLNWFRSRSLESRLSETKIIRIFGIRFKIRRINALDYLNGSKSVLQIYDEYQIGKSENKEPDTKKIISHYTEVIMAGVVEPKLSRKEDGQGMYVQNLFTDFELANRLYEEIMLFTYGKKKI